MGVGLRRVNTMDLQIMGKQAGRWKETHGRRDGEGN
jgi:hypothetical protein